MFLVFALFTSIRSSKYIPNETADRLFFLFHSSFEYLCLLATCLALPIITSLKLDSPILHETMMPSPWYALFFLVLIKLSHATPDADTCDAATTHKNAAFVFVKPHANTPSTRKLVSDKLIEAGVEILSESDIDGKDIDEKSLIDNHYFSIASKATILPPEKIPVPENKFANFFAESYADVLKENRACNAMQACERFQCTPMELNDAWRQAEKDSKVVKFGGGFYCGKLLKD